METRAPARRGGALETGLRILEALAAGRTMGVTELSRRVGADKANVYRLLKVLGASGYVRQDDASKEYRPTARLVALAGEIIHDMDLLTVVRPLMDALKEATDESTHVSVPTDLGAIYVAQKRNRGVSVDTEIGSISPLHATACGKAIYAFLPAERWHALVPDPLPRYTMRTIESLSALERNFAQVRERGYAIDDEELEVGVRCIAAPIFDMHGEVIGALGVSGAATRVTLDRVESLATLVMEFTGRATLELGGRSPLDAEGRGWSGLLEDPIPRTGRFV